MNNRLKQALKSIITNERGNSGICIVKVAEWPEELKIKDIEDVISLHKDVMFFLEGFSVSICMSDKNYDSSSVTSCAPGITCSVESDGTFKMVIHNYNDLQRAVFLAVLKDYLEH